MSNREEAREEKKKKGEAEKSQNIFLT